MSRSPLPDEVRRFLLTNVPSVPYLEAMLLLRSGAGEAWDAAKVARRLYVKESDGQKLLESLQEAGVATLLDSNDFEYAPDPELASTIDALAHYYAANLMETTELIHSRADRRAHQFADAFRLKKPGA